MKKCDRCGQMFDPYEIGKRKFVRFRNPAFEDEAAVQQNKVAHYLLNAREKADAIVDLCPDCTEDFECFMGNYPLAVRLDNNEKNVGIISRFAVKEAQGYPDGKPLIFT